MEYKAEWEIKPEHEPTHYLMQFSTNYVLMLAKELADARKLTSEEYIELLRVYREGLTSIYNHYQGNSKNQT
jgi:hypothetical protein